MLGVEGSNGVQVIAIGHHGRQVIERTDQVYAIPLNIILGVSAPDRKNHTLRPTKMSLCPASSRFHSDSLICNVF